MSTEAERKRVFGAIMSVLVIFLLFVPAYATYYIDDRLSTKVLEIEGLYENGTIIHTYEPIDKTQIDNMWSSEEITGDYANNDSYYIKKHSAGIKQNKIAYTNFVTYTGGGNYTVTPNYSIQSAPPVFDYRGIGVPLNITLHNLTQFDFIRLTSTDEHTARYIQLRKLGGQHQNTAFMDMRPDVYIYTMTLSAKTWLNSFPDEKVYVFWDGHLPTALNDSDATWNFRVEGFNLEPADAFYWEDEQLYVFSLVPVGIIWTIGLAFTTQILDVKLDTKESRKKTKGRN